MHCACVIRSAFCSRTASQFVMASIVEVVARQAQQTFSKSVKDEAFTEAFAKLVRTVGQLKAKDVNLSRDVLSESSNKTARRAPVSYIEVAENQRFTMSIFVLRNGSRIPLHDHPGMHGILKVIQGTIKIVSYSAIPRLNAEIPKDIGLKLLGGDDLKLIPVQKDCSQDVTENDEPCVLSPTQGNFHEIKAVNGSAAFLDVLAPPYDLRERDCHYYQVLETTSIDSEVKTWLKNTSAPSDFWCDSAPYHGPPIHL